MPWAAIIITLGVVTFILNVTMTRERTNATRIALSQQSRYIDPTVVICEDDPVFDRLAKAAISQGKSAVFVMSDYLYAHRIERSDKEYADGIISIFAGACFEMEVSGPDDELLGALHGWWLQKDLTFDVDGELREMMAGILNDYGVPVDNSAN